MDQDAAGQGGRHFVERVSAAPFAPTLQRLEKAIADAGLTIFARIDHAAAAHGVGMAMPATVVLIYGNPRGGTPVMLATPRAALDLPLRVLMRQDDGGEVLVGWHPIGAVLQAAGVPAETAARLGAAQAVLSDALDDLGAQS